MDNRKMRLSHDQVLNEAFDQLESLKSLCRQFTTGNHTVYKSMSGILRILLVGSSGEKALVKHVLPVASLLPLRLSIVESPRDKVIAPGELCITNDAGGELHLSAGSALKHVTTEDGGIVLSHGDSPGIDVVWRTELGQIIDPCGERMLLDAWLQQSILWADWSIEKFIKCVANKDGGAHVDRDRRIAQLQACGHIHWHITHKVSVYVAGDLQTQLRQQYPAFKRAQR